MFSCRPFVAKLHVTSSPMTFRLVWVTRRPQGNDKNSGRAKSPSLQPEPPISSFHRRSLSVRHYHFVRPRTDWLSSWEGRAALDFETASSSGRSLGGEKGRAIQANAVFVSDPSPGQPERGSPDVGVPALLHQGRHNQVSGQDPNCFRSHLDRLSWWAGADGCSLFCRNGLPCLG